MMVTVGSSVAGPGVGGPAAGWSESDSARLGPGLGTVMLQVQVPMTQ